MLNNAVIMGRLTKDPELKTTANGISVTSFTIAVDRKFNKQGEEKQADFIDIIAWRGTAEFISKYFRKGSMIAVQGSIQTRMYEDKNGNKRKAVEIVADEVSFCGDKNINAAPAPTTPTITPSDEEYRDIPEQNFPWR
jgi:single-strand DNA-binding protein